MNLVIIDTRTNESYPVYGLQWNEAQELVNWQTSYDIDGYVKGGHWRDFTKYHEIKNEEECI